MRSLVQRLQKSLINWFVVEYRKEDLALPAVVFAPHQDDETLGCGATILHKRQAGADVGIVFMTDGTGSHSQLMPSEVMRERRAAEAVAAAEVLGVPRNAVYFLNLPDGKLEQHEAAGVEQVTEILRQRQPAEVFVPCHGDGPLDHHATTRIVLAAVARCRPEAMIYEYPVWYWLHWPWVDLSTGLRDYLREVQRGLGRARTLTRDFRCCVRMDGVRERKRAALEQHHTQMEHLVADPGWVTLGDIAGGDWLKCFFQEWELFYRHPLNDKAPESK